MRYRRVCRRYSWRRYLGVRSCKDRTAIHKGTYIFL